MPNPFAGLSGLFKQKTPRLDLQQPPYDQSTFEGRLRHFVRLTSPLNLLVTPTQLDHARSLVDAYIHERTLPPRLDNPQSNQYTPEELWQAKYTVDSTLHPDTKEPVLLPFRMSCFVPTNLLVTAGLLLPSPSMTSVMFWQWLNQSVNVGFNWANANKSSPVSLNDTLMAYGAAVTSSVTVALGLRHLAQHMSPLVQRLVPFAAVSVAGCLNVGLMRYNELEQGISVMDQDGRVVGKSTEAGWRAVSQVAVSRVCTALPVLTLPPLVMAMVDPWVKRRPVVGYFAQLALITVSLMTALPVAIAVFPQQGRIPVDELEPECGKQLPSGLKEVYFNKGL